MDDLTRAYAVLDIKAIDAEQRLIDGIASTPAVDRQGDSMDPAGAQFTLPIPFLAHHHQDEPIGAVTAASVTPAGIAVTIQIAKDTGLDYVESTWKQIKSRLVRGLSIGWKPLEAPTPIKGGLRWSKWLLAELSAVTIPANVEATILTVKSAASGLNPPGVTGSPKVPPMTITEQIAAFEAKRAASFAAAKALQDGVSAENRSKTDDERTRFDELNAEVKACDLELKDLREMDRLNVLAATPIPSTTPPDKQSALRDGAMPVIQVKSQLPKGTAFTRMVMALAAARGDSFAALERAKSWPDTPEVELLVKAAVAPGTTTDATWAGPLVVTQPINEFLEMLRPRTLLGRIPGMRQVPFNISLPAQTTGGTYAWVGQNKPKPVTKADYSTVTVGFAKAAGIIVITEELARLSTPSAEALVREEMIAGMQYFLDQQFQDPAVAAVTNVNPASITNGASTAASAGSTAANAKTDITGRVATMTAAGIPLEGCVWLMNDSNAFGLSVSLNALGQQLFPTVTPTGGTLMGMPIIVSNALSTRVVLMHAPSILYADEGGVRIDVSREASVQLDSAPTDPTDATTVLVSLWQRNLIGLKAERFISWTRARTAAVTYLTAVSWNGS